MHTITLVETVGTMCLEQDGELERAPLPRSPSLLLTSLVTKYQALNLDELIQAHDEGNVILVQFAGDGKTYFSSLIRRLNCNTTVTLSIHPQCAHHYLGGNCGGTLCLERTGR